MARPWPKKSAWPYVAKSGRKSYTVGFYDHEKRERSRAFPSVRHARAWMDDYVTAERRGWDSLRRFLLDLDAKEANDTEARSIGEVLGLYLAVNAHPRNEGGLAPSTYDRYEWTIGRHLLGRPRRRPQGGMLAPPRYAVAVASVPAARFNGPQAPRAWREDMQLDGVSKPTRDQAWSVLSAALSWAASSHLVPEIQTNGCGLANEPRVNRRRSMRAGGTGYAPPRRRRGLGVASWALSPQAVEAIRAQMLLRVNGRREILTQRDAMVVSLQYGLGTGEMWISMWLELGRRGGVRVWGLGSGSGMSGPVCRRLARRETGGRLLLAHYRRRKGKHKPDGLLLDVGARARPVSARGCYFSSRAQSRRMSSARPLPPNEHE
jgi:hypothetical protein